MTAAEVVAKALKAWVDERRTGFVVLNFRHGVLKDVEHQIKEFVSGDGSARRADETAPDCPHCEKPMTTRDGGRMWLCACGIKRTAAQIGG